MIVNDIKIYIFNFINLSLYQSFEIYSYQKELISFNVNSNIKIAYLKNSEKIIIKQVKLYKSAKSKILLCKKDNDMSFIYIQFNTKGNLLAAACKEYIYLYNTSNGECTREIYNENLPFENINCMKFNCSDKYLAISTLEKNNGNIYIFDIGKENEKGFLDYFFKEYDKYFAYYKLTCAEFIFSFDINDNIIIFTSNGEFFKVFFDKKNGEIKLIQNKKIFI